MTVNAVLRRVEDVHGSHLIVKQCFGDNGYIDLSKVLHANTRLPCVERAVDTDIHSYVTRMEYRGRGSITPTASQVNWSMFWKIGSPWMHATTENVNPVCE
jgi:hypothetical protein